MGFCFVTFRLLTGKGITILERIKALLGIYAPDAHAQLERERLTEAAIKRAEESAVVERANFEAAADKTLTFLRRVLASEVGPTDRCELAHSLVLQRTRLRKLPGNLVIQGDLRLDGCQRFQRFTGDELTVKGDLVIGGPRLNNHWIGDDQRAKEHGRRVNEFLTQPAVESQSPFSQWPRKVTVAGDVTLVNCRQLTALPEEFSFGGDIQIVNCGLESLPAGMKVHGKLTLDNCPMAQLPRNLVAERLELRNLTIREFADDLMVQTRLAIKCCPALIAIRMKQVCDWLVVQQCGLKELPGEACRARFIRLRECPISVLEIPDECHSLNIRNCENLNEIRIAHKEIGLGYLQIKNCPELSQLPSGLSLQALQLSNLPALKRLPKDLTCRTTIELVDTELEAVAPG